MRILTENRDLLLGFAKVLEEKAKEVWQCDTSGVHTINLRPADDIDFKEVLRKGYEWENERLLSEFQKSCADIGIDSFQRYSSGSREGKTFVASCETTDGYQLTVRFSKASSISENRILLPLSPQTHKVWSENDYRIEVMPLLPMVNSYRFCKEQQFTPDRQEDSFYFDSDIDEKLGLEEVPDMFQNFSFLEEYIADIDHVRFRKGKAFERDVAVLPNGLLVQVDPGEIKHDFNEFLKEKTYQVKFELSQIAIQTVFDRVRKANIFEYFDKDGNWAQDKFFPNPFPDEPPKPRPIVG